MGFTSHLQMLYYFIELQYFTIEIIEYVHKCVLTISLLRHSEYAFIHANVRMYLLPYQSVWSVFSIAEMPTNEPRVRIQAVPHHGPI